VVRRMSTRALDLTASAERRRVAEILDEHGLTIAVGALAVGLLFVLTAGAGMVSDSWLALVGGREIAEHGLPLRDHLATVTAGRRWANQQWLGQLGLYELYRITHDAFAIVVTLLTSLPALLAALLLGRRWGTDRLTAVVVLISVMPFLMEAPHARTQSLAYPLFVVLLALLLSRQTWHGRIGALLLIALWANVHGSVLIAAAIASLRWLQDIRSQPRRTGLLLAATWLATLCSPYARWLPEYYGSTVFNPAFGEVLTQWQPLGFTARAVPIWLLVIGSLWLLARNCRDLWRFEPAVLLVLVALTIHSVRTAPFLALASIALVPRLVGRPVRTHSEWKLRTVIAVASLVMGMLMTLAALTHVRFGLLQPAAASAVSNRAAAGKVFVPLELGDWLLWREPGLRGRVAADARAELLTPNELRQFAKLWKGADGWRRLTAGYDSFLLSPTDERWLVRRLVSRPAQYRLVYRDPKLVVVVRRSAG
jgi:hypothetical protein